MTTYTPPAEAVEAALRTREFVAGAAFGIPADAMEQAVTAALTAAGPIIAVQALRWAADALDRDDMAADRWYAEWLRDRAARLARGERP